MTMPTPCANRGGASASVRAGGPSLGRTSRRYRRPYGAYRNPASAPTANTTSCAASSQILPVIRTTASTITVIAAPNLGPRGSISTVVLLATERLPPGRVAAPAHLDIAGAVISDAVGDHRLAAGRRNEGDVQPLGLEQALVERDEKARRVRGRNHGDGEVRFFHTRRGRPAQPPPGAPT